MKMDDAGCGGCRGGVWGGKGGRARPGGASEPVTFRGVSDLSGDLVEPVTLEAWRLGDYIEPATLQLDRLGDGLSWRTSSACLPAAVAQGPADGLRGQVVFMISAASLVARAFYAGPWAFYLVQGRLPGVWLLHLVKC